MQIRLIKTTNLLIKYNRRKKKLFKLIILFLVSVFPHLKFNGINREKWKKKFFYSSLVFYWKNFHRTETISGIAGCCWWNRKVLIEINRRVGREEKLFLYFNFQHFKQLEEKKSFFPRFIQKLTCFCLYCFLYTSIMHVCLIIKWFNKSQKIIISVEMVRKFYGAINK